MSSAMARSSLSISSLARATTASRRASRPVSRSTSWGRASERSSSFMRRITSAAALRSVGVSWAAATGATAKRNRTATGSVGRMGGPLVKAGGTSYTLSAMSVKIVFNGTEYDGVEAMPPDVRRAYEAALESLGKAGGETLASLLKDGSGGGASIKATFREVVVNGKK